jgi:FdhE protein
VEQALSELAQLVQARPVLEGPIAFLRVVLPALYRETPHEKAPPLTGQHASAKLAGGVPLLQGETWQPDEAAFRRRWRHVAAALELREPGAAAQSLADALRSGALDPGELVRDVLAGRPGQIHTRSEALGLDPGLVATALRLALFPALSHVHAALAPIRASHRWDQGYCPTCGSWPLLGEFRSLEQVRLLRCGLCAAEWEFARLRCPFCGTRDHEVLGYLAVDGEDTRYRAATCDACRGYVKMVATLAALTGPGLLVADVATLHLDLVAAEHGYGPPG